MNNYLKVGLAFVTGLAVGAFATKKYLEYKEEQNETEDVVIGNEEDNEEVDVIDNDENNEEVVEAQSINNTINRINYNNIKSTEDESYKRILNDLRYRNDNNAGNSLENNYVEPEEVDRNKPYNISQADFEDRDAYESDEYTVYADGYVTDSYGMPLSPEDIDNSIGTGFEQYFGTYCDDQVWIRNERLQMDFSIIRDIECFADVAPARIKRMIGLN